MINDGRFDDAEESSSEEEEEEVLYDGLPEELRALVGDDDDDPFADDDGEGLPPELSHEATHEASTVSLTDQLRLLPFFVKASAGGPGEQLELYEHEVLPFEGTRMSLVYFTHSSLDGATEADVELHQQALQLDGKGKALADYKSEHSECATSRMQ